LPELFTDESDSMIAITQCPSCRSEKIKKARRKWTGKFHGQTYSVPRLEFHECPACGEKVYDREAMRKIEAHSPALVKARAS
jgi:YgiT-type zinc finger domain-containing protein